MTLRRFVKDALKRTPLFVPVRELYTRFTPALAAFRRVEEADLARIRAQVGDALCTPLHPPGGPTKRVLIMGMGRVRFIAQEAVVRKSFELAGYETQLVIPQDRMVIDAYRALGSDTLVFYDHHEAPLPSEGKALLARCQSLDDLTDLVVGGVRCGKYAASTLMRKVRSGTFDLNDPATRLELEAALDRSLQCARTAERLIAALRPDALVLVDRGYSPSGELFDSCINRGIPVFTWNAAHRNDTLMLKRYTEANRDVHPSSLSASTWRALTEQPIGQAESDEVMNELVRCYRSGEWYGEVGTQFNTQAVDRAKLIERLGLDPSKKTAVIFPHIFWDATFFWGVDLFENYEAWFVESVRAACANPQVNWVIKVHPANVVKNLRDGVTSEHSEISAIRKSVGTLPPHVHLLPADTDISTLSLFPLMDCCVTVRGTVGIEAACFGVPVLTAGTGRYDGLGFTLDSSDRAQYLARIAHVQDLAPLTPAQTRLAHAHAFGVLLWRPASLAMMRMRYQANATADLDVQFTVRDASELAALPDLRSIADWIASGAEDYLDPERRALPSTTA